MKEVCSVRHVQSQFPALTEKQAQHEYDSLPSMLMAVLPCDSQFALTCKRSPDGLRMTIEGDVTKSDLDADAYRPLTLVNTSTVMN